MKSLGSPHFAIAADAVGIYPVFLFMMPPICVGEVNLPQSASYVVGLMDSSAQHDLSSQP